MGFLVKENTRIQPHLIEHNRPMLLKDFLREHDGKSRSTVAVSSKSKKPHIVLLRSWSKRAAATKMSAVHKVIKLLQFTSSRSPSSVLPRSISRKLTKRSAEGNNDMSETKVKVKDILRWRSFRDLVDDDPTPLDFPPSPDRSAATTTSCSKSSSWCDSDFTAEELPPWAGENQEFWGKNAATLKNPKGDWTSFEEDEQQSPVSVLASPFRQVEEFISHHQTLAINVQRTKRSVTRRSDHEHNFDKEIEICGATEEKARQLLSHLKTEDDNVMLDFFIHEVSINGKLNDDEFDCKTLRIAKSWMDGEFEEYSYEWDVEEKRESFVKNMEKGNCWNKFEQEQQELTHQLELWVFNYLIDDLVADFITR